MKPLSTVRLSLSAFSPSSILNNEDVLLLASCPSVSTHKLAIESYIRLNSPIVIALNTVSSIASEYIDYRISCHPLRLLVDSSFYANSAPTNLTLFIT